MDGGGRTRQPKLAERKRWPVRNKTGHLKFAMDEEQIFRFLGNDDSSGDKNWGAPGGL